MPAALTNLDGSSAQSGGCFAHGHAVEIADEELQVGSLSGWLATAEDGVLVALTVAPGSLGSIFLGAALPGQWPWRALSSLDLLLVLVRSRRLPRLSQFCVALCCWPSARSRWWWTPSLWSRESKGGVGLTVMKLSCGSFGASSNRLCPSSRWFGFLAQLGLRLCIGPVLWCAAT